MSEIDVCKDFCKVINNLVSGSYSGKLNLQEEEKFVLVNCFELLHKLSYRVPDKCHEQSCILQAGICIRDLLYFKPEVDENV